MNEWIYVSVTNHQQPLPVWIEARKPFKRTDESDWNVTRNSSDSETTDSPGSISPEYVKFEFLL